MCGISGVLNYPMPQALAPVIKRMSAALRHRGPDAAETWLDKSCGLALGHQRLAIIDLLPTGQQPMQSSDERYVMVFNGEIYNHRQLRSELNSQTTYHWRGTSDSETLLAGFATWGITATLERCVGMFAIALWDTQRRQLHLIRDRVGEKPLYYGYLGTCFAFASELKALRTLPIFEQSINRNALNSYLHYGYIPAPDSIYQDIHKLPPGTLLTLDYSAEAPQQTPVIKQWWSFTAMAQQARQRLITDEVEARERLQQQLQQSVSLQACADVPVGAFLSGGIDSTSIVNQLCKSSSQSVKTFSVGFTQPSYNEAEHAAAIAKLLDTQHEEIYVDGKEARDVIPLLPHIYDEPFADTSQIPTYLIAKHAQQYVSVALSGDAGDELFGGYSSYLHSPAIWRKVQHFPLPVRNLLAKLLTQTPPRYWDWLGRQLNSGQLNGTNLHKLGNGLYGCRTLADFFIRLGLQLPESQSLVLGNNTFQAIRLADEWWADTTPESAMILSDSVNGLPDDILCKVDRAAMAVSLETRIPFLDHRLIELAWRIPLEMKIQHGRGKHILRELLYEDIPAAMMERPKQGFTVPLGDWLRGELRDWAEDLLDEDRLRGDGYLDVGEVRECWRGFLSGRRANQQLLWGVLMFQAWLD